MTPTILSTLCAEQRYVSLVLRVLPSGRYEAHLWGYPGDGATPEEAISVAAGLMRRNRVGE